MVGLLCSALSILTLSGCASNDEQARQLEILASNRAGILSAGLPLEYGPLQVMSATAKRHVIEIMMIYNDSAPGAKPISDVVSASVSYYCNNPEIKSQLDKGLLYRIKLRNSRGQLMVDEYISAPSCATK
ncbi:type II secretion system pilot lipoprotein GspS-beta [Vibrio sp. SM6]|uniref:Type II secretion system pilot lipoprotein GspS-beta n=1 Tax=Vibrio agarilyticus TaxID=2726741 RepID=A0A7X8TR08_9VIBR|nr:GspS/AspS pilotin family protein [Vibrio agarilyticus]NLS13007.1 type II secretion system pilot lipoprotein GspS-beta [Vibrio agarilyticus]